MKPIAYEIKPTGKLSLGLKELWEFRELFYFFTWRDIKVKYKQTVLGFAWAVLQPFLMMIIFSVLFRKVFNDPSNNIPYPVFVYSGLLLWNVFSTGITSAGNSMVANSNIIKKIYFPRLIIPASSVLVALFDFAAAFLILVGLLIYYQVPVNLLKMACFMPAGLLITVVATFGIGSWLAALNIKYRDFRYVIPFLILALLFLTPVIYPPGIYEQWKFLVALNPMYSAIEFFRCGLTNRPVDLLFALISMSSALAFFLLGIFYFRKTESYFADLA
jgi:lipopolysaccharide transport system permease protein